MRLDPPPTCLGRCLTCNKITYQTKRDAKRFARHYPAAHLRAYRCPHTPGWHLGHIDPHVANGTLPRQQRYRPKGIT